MLFVCLVLICGKLLEFGIQGKAPGAAPPAPGRAGRAHQPVATGENFDFSAT